MLKVDLEDFAGDGIIPIEEEKIEWSSLDEDEEENQKLFNNLVN